jgi:hypothetical protein
MTSRDTTLRFRPIAAGVVRTARRHAGPILAVSIAVSAVTVAAELAADHLLGGAGLTTALAGSLSTSMVSLLGAVFLSGFLCRLVSDTEHGETGHGETGHRETGHRETGHRETGHRETGHRETGHRETGHDTDGTRIRDVLRSLPWGSLILADLLAALIIVAGLLALIIPGLIAITLLAVVGPVIEIEHRHAVAGLRRAAHLVRPQFWRVAAFGTLPLVLANGIVAVLPDPSGTTGVVTTVVVRSAGEGILEAAVGLLLVELCYRLIAAERDAARPAVQPVGGIPGGTYPGCLPGGAYPRAPAGAGRDW